MSGFTRAQAVKGTTSAWTRSLRHANAVLPRWWAKAVSFGDPRIKHVKPNDRIKWWNIVPGDQVRVRNDPECTLREVQLVNKLSNMVYLKRNKEADSETALPRSEGVHYSECQLYIGKHQFPPEPGSSEPRILPVFASRVDMTTPRWLTRKGHFMWTRFAANTTPRLPGLSGSKDDRVILPWPKLPARPKIEPTLYDTPLEAVKQITYIKPALPASAQAPLPKLPSEHKYIKSLSKTARINPAAPLEVYVHKELTNPHSRAKKQSRWQARKEERRMMLQQIMKAELKSLNGRTRRVAKQDAVWKWKNKILMKAKDEKRKKRVDRGEVAHLRKKSIMKARKVARLERKLQGLTLEDAPNQVVPGRTTL